MKKVEICFVSKKQISTNILDWTTICIDFIIKYQKFVSFDKRSYN